MCDYSLMMIQNRLAMERRRLGCAQISNRIDRVCCSGRLELLTRAGRPGFFLKRWFCRVSLI